jgi:hypothetical protein
LEKKRMCGFLDSEAEKAKPMARPRQARGARIFDNIGTSGERMKDEPRF